MTIGVIIEAVIPRGPSGTTTPTPGPKPKEPIKDWIKKQLSNLGKLLAKLAGKAAEALPGIIGAIVSWLLSATWKGDLLGLRESLGCSCFCRRITCCSCKRIYQ